MFSFSQSERRGILWLLPLLAVVASLLLFANRPRFEKSFLQQVEEEVEAQSGKESEIHSGEVYGYHAGTDGGSPAAADDRPHEGELFEFDPNTVTLQQLCRLGFTRRTAAGIIKYRERGKRFEIPEDFATCYGVELEHYARLEPYIIIGAEYRARPHGRRTDADRPLTDMPPLPAGTARDMPPLPAGTAGVGVPALSDFDPNRLDSAGYVALGFSQAQARTIIRYRNSIGGFRTPEDFARSYVVSQAMYDRLKPHIRIAPQGGAGAVDEGAGADVGERAEERRLVELNSADSAGLRSVRGIGEVLVVRIMDYRERLGGFVSHRQLAEIPGVTEENYSRICQQIFVDSCVIQKIDINFATPQTVVDALGKHPYMTAKGLRKLLKNRQLKGGWRSIGDLVDQNIVTSEQAEKLAPYLIFNAL